MATTTSLRWRVIDIVTAAVLGVACGLIFVAWNQVGYAGYEFLKGIAPGPVSYTHLTLPTTPYV